MNVQRGVAVHAYARSLKELFPSSPPQVTIDTELLWRLHRLASLSEFLAEQLALQAESRSNVLHGVRYTRAATDPRPSVQANAFDLENKVHCRVERRMEALL